MISSILCEAFLYKPIKLRYRAKTLEDDFVPNGVYIAAWEGSANLARYQWKCR